MVDIIIPIYNGYEVILPCMESVLRHTDLKNNRVLLVNDCSPDERILPLLNSYCKKNDNIILINSQKNEGFPASVNKGITYSDKNDVILLNSDTVVTKNWVEKIKACAYSKPEISTVTPLSNRATLCSVPEICVDNDLPENFTIDEFAELVEKVSLRKYPEISVAVGFCMFIKREVIKKIGLFDAETFGKGYGEENDFCSRAQQLGYIDAMCDDTFIFHSGSASFLSEQKKALCKAHEKILQKRYPKQKNKNAIYCTTNPDQDIRDNLKIYIPLHNGRKKILYVAHYGFDEHYTFTRGGVQYHVKDLVNYMRKKFDVFFAARNGNYLTLTLYTKNKEYYFNFPIPNVDSFAKVTDSVLADLWKAILTCFDIDLIHVHHILSLSDDIFHVAKSLNIPIVLTCHDYFFLCPNFELFKNGACFCGYIPGNDKACKKCLSETMDIYEHLEYKNFWQEKNENILKSCEKIIFPSEFIKNIFAKRYKLNNAIVISHGSDNFGKKQKDFLLNVKTDLIVKSCIETCDNEKNKLLHISGWAYLEDIDSSNAEIYLRFTTKDGKTSLKKASKFLHADIGNMFGEKYKECGFRVTIAGGDKNLPANEKIEYQIIVYDKNKNICNISDDKHYFKMLPFPRTQDALKVAFIGGLSKGKGADYVYSLIKDTKNLNVVWYCMSHVCTEEISKLNANNFILYGDYEREELPTILDSLDIDVICILSILGETFCYTLSEAINCKKPFIVTDIGALGERAREYNCGWLVPVNDVKKQTEIIIKSLVNNRHLLEEKQRLLTKIPMKSTNEMGAEYESMYNDLLNKKHKNKRNQPTVEYLKKILAAHYAWSSMIRNRHNMTIIDCENSLNKANAELNAIRDSFSWKITKPLRKIKKVIKKLM